MTSPSSRGVAGGKRRDRYTGKRLLSKAERRKFAAMNTRKPSKLDYESGRTE